MNLDEQKNNGKLPIYQGKGLMEFLEPRVAPNPDQRNTEPEESRKGADLLRSWWECKMVGASTSEKSLTVPQNVRPSYHMTQQSTQGYRTNRTENTFTKHLHRNVHSSIIHNSQRVETTRIPIS